MWLNRALRKCYLAVTTYHCMLVESSRTEGREKFEFAFSLSSSECGCVVAQVPPEEDGVNQKVGLFFAGWFVLSCILSIVVGMK